MPMTSLIGLERLRRVFVRLRAMRNMLVLRSYFHPDDGMKPPCYQDPVL